MGLRALERTLRAARAEFLRHRSACEAQQRGEGRGARPQHAGAEAVKPEASAFFTK